MTRTVYAEVPPRVEYALTADGAAAAERGRRARQLERIAARTQPMNTSWNGSRAISEARPPGMPLA